MTLTKATPEGLPPQRQHLRHVGSGECGDHNWSPTRTVTVNNLPDEVLLEIFDIYRWSFGGQPGHARVWNNKNGWFKLAHVCHNWRCVVLASPSRLRLRLHFADITPTRAVALERLSHLPIFVDYRNVTWNASAQKRLISALRYPERVCGIAIRGSKKNTDKICESLDLPFPMLQSLELHKIGDMEFILRAASLMMSIQSLRHLLLSSGRLISLLPILSHTRALVNLTLSVDTVFCVASGASLLNHLQHMPHLRVLQVNTLFCYNDPPPTTTVLLAKLTCFRFFGNCAEMEWFVAALATPSLRELHISVTDISGTLHIPHLSNYIRIAGIFFFAARLTISELCLTTSLFAHPHPHSIDGPPFKIVSIDSLFTPRPGGVPSAMLATLEDVFLSLYNPLTFDGPPLGELAPWRRFFEEFRNVKVLRLQHGLEKEVAEILRYPTLNPPLPREEVDLDTTTPSATPINSDRGQFSLNILPLLEEIVVYARTSETLVCEKECASGIESFGPFAIARKEGGRPVKVSWNTDGEVPSYFMEGQVVA